MFSAATASPRASLQTPMPSKPTEARAVGWVELAPHRGYLVSFARRRLNDPALAEDLAHDVFEAVASGRASFGGRSALRSWLVAILKHKIVDLIRQRSGHDSLESAATDDEGQRQHAALLCPRAGPDELAELRQDLALTLARIKTLPQNLRQVMELRVLRDLSSEDVCRRLAISSQNLFVRLHRARRALAA